MLTVSSFLVASNSGHRFFAICFLRRQHSFCASRSRLPLSTVSVLLSPLHSFALVTQRPLIRSFLCSKTDRPSRTSGICRLQNCRSSSAAFSFSQSSSCVFHTLLPSTCSETKFVGRVPAERLDADVRPQSSSDSIFCRLLTMFRRILCTCGFPPPDFHTTNRAPVYRRGGRHRKRHTGS